jgi:hypothetical protein
MMISNTTVLMRTPICLMCSANGFVEVSSEGYVAHKRGAAIQEAFPELDKSLREQIISGTHPKCWESMTAGLENK